MRFVTCTRTERLPEPATREAVVRATPLEALAGPAVPTDAHFRRDHFAPPSIDAASWRLEVAAASGAAQALSLSHLQSLPRHELRVALECAGHRRSEFQPPIEGVAWGVGAVAEAVWAGASLSHVLADVELGAARFVVCEGADRGEAGGKAETAFAKGLPLEKALHPDTLLAWEMNGEPLPVGHGAPVRLIVPGWYASDSIKWLQRIELRERPFEGHFEVDDYRLRLESTDAGERLETMSVNSLLTSHGDGDGIEPGWQLLSGIAWGGTGGVARIEVSTRDGDWAPARATARDEPYGFARWSFRWNAPPGLQTIAVRATDATGASQPDRPVWNAGGYANSSIHRTRLLVG
jgi:sulfite oxidase